MGISWGLLGLIQITTNRHLKGHLWLYLHVHTILGIIIPIITIVVPLFAWYYKDWEFVPSPHLVGNFPVFFLNILVPITGILTRIYLNKADWNTRRTL